MGFEWEFKCKKTNRGRKFGKKRYFLHLSFHADWKYAGLRRIWSLTVLVLYMPVSDKAFQAWRAVATHKCRRNTGCFVHMSFLARWQIFNKTIFAFAKKIIPKDAECASSSIFIPNYRIQAKKRVLSGKVGVKRQTVARNLVKNGIFCTFPFTPIENTQEYAGFDCSQCSFFICQGVIKHFQLGEPWRLINAGEIQGALCICSF